jgi:DNA-binding MarR family transcriptional regulator
MTNIIDLVISLKSKCLITDDQIRSKTPLSPSEYHCIMGIGENEKLSATEFSERVGLSVSRGSRVIEKMIQNGYLSRFYPDEDRRGTIVSLSPKGIELQKDVIDIKNTCENKIRSRLTGSQLIEIESAIKKLIEVL